MPEMFSASRAGRHMQCHASANLALAIPHWTPPEEDPNADNAASRGSRMHEMFADVMSLAPKDAENFAAAVTYVATVRKTRRFKKLIEEQVTAEWLTTKPKTTADLVLYVTDEIHVFDLKTGKIPVQVYGNLQLMYYAACYGHLAPNAKGVTVHIIQPWAGIMDNWFIDTQTLAQFMVDAQATEAAIQAGSTQFTPGDACKFCPANPHSRTAKGRPLCPEMMQLLYPAPFDEAAILTEEN